MKKGKIDQNSSLKYTKFSEMFSLYSCWCDFEKQLYISI